MALVPPDSPLRRVPPTLERKHLLFYDAIRYSLHIFDLASTRLRATLIELTGDQERDSLADRIAAAISDAWTMVDTVHRLRLLLQRAPNLKRNEPELQIFVRGTEQSEDLRHYIQHLEKEVAEVAAETVTGPIWGALSWVYDNPKTGRREAYTIAPGTAFAGGMTTRALFDRRSGQFVPGVILMAGASQLDLAALEEQVRRFTLWYTEWFSKQFADTDHEYLADLHSVLRAKPVQRHEGNSETGGETGGQDHPTQGT